MHEFVLTCGRVLLFYVCMWPAYAMLLILAVPLWYVSRKRVQWNKWDYGLLIVPYTVWTTLMMYDERHKSLSNLVEVFAVSGVALLAVIVRVIVGNVAYQKVLSAVFMAAVSIAAWCAWYFTPSLPE